MSGANKVDSPRYVNLADFETDFGFMADTARAKGATPIFVTPMGHRSFNGSMVTNTLLPYANAMKTEAAAKMKWVKRSAPAAGADRARWGRLASSP